MIQIINNNIYVPRGESETLAWEMSNNGAPYVNTNDWLSGRVITVSNYASLPVTGVVGKYYLTTDTDLIYIYDEIGYNLVEDITAILPQLSLELLVTKNVYSSRRNVLKLTLELSYDNFLYKIFNSQYDKANSFVSDNPVWDADDYSLRTLYKAIGTDSVSYEFGYFAVVGLDESTEEPIIEWVRYETPVLRMHLSSDATIDLEAQAYLYELYYTDSASKRTLLKPHNFVVEATAYGR